MQFKPITAIIVLTLVLASLLVAGCTNSTSTPTATATPKDTEAKVAYLETYLSLQGYTTALKVVGTTDEGYLIYSGNAIKGGMQYTVSVIETDSRSNAMSRFSRDVTEVKALRFAGNYTNSTYWQGTMTDKGTFFKAAVLLIDDKWVVTMFGE
jgi:hypothetical protein